MPAGRSYVNSGIAGEIVAGLKFTASAKALPKLYEEVVHDSAPHSKRVVAPVLVSPGDMYTSHIGRFVHILYSPEFRLLSLYAASHGLSSTSTRQERATAGQTRNSWR